MRNVNFVQHDWISVIWMKENSTANQIKGTFFLKEKYRGAKARNVGAVKNVPKMQKQKILNN